MMMFLRIAAALGWLVDLGLLTVPAAIYQPTGIMMTPMLGTVVKARGAALPGLGVIKWAGSRLTGSAVTAPMGGNLVVQLQSPGVVVHTAWPGAEWAILPGVLIQVRLGTLFGLYFQRARRNPA